MLLLSYMLLLATASCVIVRGPSGPHPVTYTIKSLTDNARWDPLAPSNEPSKRRILVSIFSPLEIEGDSDCQLADPISYLPPATAAQYAVILESLGLPPYLLDEFELQFCESPSAKEETLSSELPVIIFSPGFSTTRLLSSAQAQSLASHGYTVITVDHPHDATIVEFPNGEVTYGFNISDANDKMSEQLAEIRAADVSFLIDQLPHVLGLNHKHHRETIAFVYGHSLGGGAAALAVSLDSRVRGGLDFDGTIYGSVNETGLKKPFILAGASAAPGVPDDGFYNGFYNRLYGKKMLITVNDTKHLSFCDAPLLVSLRDDITDEQRPLLDAVFGSVDGMLLAQILDEILIATAQLVLEDKTEGLCNLNETVEGLLVLRQDLSCPT